ncbi:MAG: tRNA epoxyqueuosine(34) reductase QueG, partial [Armatimonadota bacterium]
LRCFHSLSPLAEKAHVRRMVHETLTGRLKQEAQRQGFELVGVCPAVAPAGLSRLRDWLDAGYAGEMSYLPQRLAAYEHPRSILDGVRSLLMLGMNYRTAEPSPPARSAGRVSRYAWGTADYHDLIHGRLKQLSRYLSDQIPGARIRGVVDTAPLLEREFAQLAGLGWIGKNTLLINQQLGSWFFLAALLTDQELEYDAQQAANHCGTCRACLDACPTRAFPEPYVLDANRCLSYLTIELRGAISPDLRTAVGERVFGCDVCQEVCPWNRRAPVGTEPAFAPAPGMNPLPLEELFFWHEARFRERFRRTPLWRSKRRGLLRNAAIVLGNQHSIASLEALICGLHDAEPVVRAACVWALRQFDELPAAQALRECLNVEHDPDVRAEILLAENASSKIQSPSAG